MRDRANGNIRSGIIFTASTLVVIPNAGHGTYGGTKAFVDYLSRSIAHENRDKIDVFSY
jgi:short-subunit dehydrogenase